MAKKNTLSDFLNALYEPSDFVGLSLLPVKGTNGKAKEETVKAEDLPDILTPAFFKSCTDENRFACLTPNTIKKGARRKAENVETLNAVFVDVDNELPGAVAQAAHIILQRDEYHSHFYFLLERLPATEENKKRVQGLTKRLIDLIGGDKAVHDPARVLRVPYAPHVKNGKTSKGYEIKKLNPKKRYTVEELEKIAGLSEPTLPAAPTTETQTQTKTIDEAGKLNFLRNHYKQKGAIA